MRPLKDYSVVRLMLVTGGVTVIVGILQIAASALLRFGSTSSWSQIINGAIAGVVIIGVIAHISKNGRDRQLLRKELREKERKCQ
jgi:hypothetical protein